VNGKAAGGKSGTARIYGCVASAVSYTENRNKPNDEGIRRITMRYLTDGTHLYEIVARRTVQNYGLRRGTMRYLVIRDCVTEATATIDDLQLAALSEVC
jgi:hypothetical protein